MKELKIRKDRTPAVLRQLAKDETDPRVTRRILATYAVASPLAGGLDSALNDTSTIPLPAVVSVRHNIFDERKCAPAPRKIETNDEHAGADAGTVHVANEDRCAGMSQDAG